MLHQTGHAKLGQLLAHSLLKLMPLLGQVVNHHVNDGRSLAIKAKQQARHDCVFKSDLILPLKASRFEDTDVYVPNDIESCLIQEYGPNVLKNTYKYWFFDTNTWTKKQD